MAATVFADEKERRSLQTSRKSIARLWRLQKVGFVSLIAQDFLNPVLLKQQFALRHAADVLMAA